MIPQPSFHCSNYDLPARAPGRLALPVRHRLRLRRMPGVLGWRASLQWQAASLQWQTGLPSRKHVASLLFVENRVPCIRLQTQRLNH